MIRIATDPILKFNETVISIADETIPKTSTNPKHPGKPWFNDDCKEANKNRKKAEQHLQGESSKNSETKSTRHFNISNKLGQTLKKNSSTKNYHTEFQKF
jgi:hypothetical protein